MNELTHVKPGTCQIMFISERSQKIGGGGTVGLQEKMNWLCRGVEFEMMVAITKARLETQDSSSAECPGPDTRI